jgi:hypothetical protein
MQNGFTKRFFILFGGYLLIGAYFGIFLYLFIDSLVDYIRYLGEGSLEILVFSLVFIVAPIVAWKVARAKEAPEDPTGQ